MSVSQQKKHDDEMKRIDDVLRGNLTIKRTCPICGDEFSEHDTKSDRIGTLGSIYIDGVNYIVPMQVVSAHNRTRDENKRLSSRCIETSEKLIALTDAIDNYLNDTREKESVEELERAMKDYGITVRLDGE